MKAYVMAAVAAFFVLCGGVAVAQSAAPAAEAGVCPFHTETKSPYDCADAAKVAFDAFTSEAKKAEASAYPEYVKKLYELRGAYKKWYDVQAGAGLLAKGTGLRFMTNGVVLKAIKAATDQEKKMRTAYFEAVRYIEPK